MKHTSTMQLNASLSTSKSMTARCVHSKNAFGDREVLARPFALPAQSIYRFLPTTSFLIMVRFGLPEHSIDLRRRFFTPEPVVLSTVNISELLRCIRESLGYTVFHHPTQFFG